MYQTHKTYIKPSMRMSKLINENPTLLLMMEYFEIDYAVGDKTIERLCAENNVNMSVFLVISNLYNGFYPNAAEVSVDDLAVSPIINFLKNTHNFYKKDKYPEIQNYIQQLYHHQDKEDIAQIERFFNEYFDEVIEHLNYEDEVAFPYFCQLLKSNPDITQSKFSVREYREHHTDIETKLSDLKMLLLKHVSLKDDFTLRRRVLYRLFELERDLNIHSTIEEMVLLPLVDEIEKHKIDEHR